MATLREELRYVRQGVKDKVRHSRENSDRAEQARAVSERTWRERLKNPVPFAMDVLNSHTPDESTVCSCVDVGAANNYQEHVLHLLRDAGMLKIPPRLVGEGW